MQAGCGMECTRDDSGERERSEKEGLGEKSRTNEGGFVQHCVPLEASGSSSREITRKREGGKEGGREIQTI